MEVSDADTKCAYYMFINHGWRPSQWLELDIRERTLMSLFIQKELDSRSRNG